MADLYSLQSTLAPQDPQFVFSEKQVIYVPDSNNGSFPSGVVSFDLTSLANQSKWLDLQQSFISIPLVMQLKSTAGSFSTANVENVFAMSLKNHVFQLLHSMSLEIGNNSVVNLTNFANIDINYKILNSFSEDDVKNLGPSILFGGLDSAESVFIRCHCFSVSVHSIYINLNIFKYFIIAFTFQISSSNHSYCRSTLQNVSKTHSKTFLW